MKRLSEEDVRYVVMEYTLAYHGWMLYACHDEESILDDGFRDFYELARDKYERSQRELRKTIAILRYFDKEGNNHATAARLAALMTSVEELLNEFEVMRFIEKKGYEE